MRAIQQTKLLIYSCLRVTSKVVAVVAVAQSETAAVVGDGAPVRPMQGR